MAGTRTATRALRRPPVRRSPHPRRLPGADPTCSRSAGGDPPVATPPRPDRRRIRCRLRPAARRHAARPARHPGRTPGRHRRRPAHRHPHTAAGRHASGGDRRRPGGRARPGASPAACSPRSCRAGCPTTSSRRATATRRYRTDDPYRWLPTLGRHRPAPDQRGPARAALGRARRARAQLRHPARRGHRRLLRRLGAVGSGCAGHRRLRLLGEARLPDALARVDRGLGSSSSPAWSPARSTSSRCSARTGNGGRRPTRSPSPPRSPRRPHRSSSSRATNGPTPTGWSGARRPARTSRR